MSGVMEFEAALKVVKARAAEMAAVEGKDSVELLASRGRVLAEEIRADRDQPPFHRATRDGFAVQSGEFGLGVPVQVVGMLKAGERWAGAALASGQAIQIMTGAPLPDGADAVAMVEHVMRGEGTVKAEAGRTWRAGENVVPRGREAKVGDVVIAPGTLMGAAEIALAAALGRSEIVVRRRVKVAIAATGDELVELDETPGEMQIRNSNSYGLAAMVEAAGGEAVRLPITADERGAMASTLKRAQECDLIVLSGGVSMGEYDLVEEMLTAAGAEFFFTGVKMQPGKPVVFGKVGDRLFFGLPGNPISTQVTFHCFVEPVLRAMGGVAYEGPRMGLARMKGTGEQKPGLTRLLPGRLDGTDVSVVEWQGSGDLAANARANCYVELPPGDGVVGNREIVRVLWR